ncbi:MAG: DUF4340 domain-containing protein [Opitutae bacterium]|nr:DUF4340 domain-containing protein [Opitutae bacterium]MBT5380973.1 DUF4340 domain-containing protein [Opitutae bacterium]
MRYRVTLFLLVISTVLFIRIYLLEKQDAEKNSPVSDSIGLFGPNILDADRLELKGTALGEDEERLLRKKGNSQWQIEKPMNWPANFYIVNQVLNQIQFLPKEYSFTVNSILKAGKTLADYGLQEPRLELTLGWGEKHQVVAFGHPSEIGNRTYLLGPDRKKIYAIGQQLETSLLSKLELWRSQAIFTIPVIEIGSFSLEINDSGSLTKIRLEKTGDAWKLEAPIKANADTSLVNERINVLQGVKALGFLRGKDGQEAKEALLTPLIRITLNGATQRQTLELAEPLEEGKPFLYAKFDAYPTTYFIVSGDPFDNLQQAQTYFRQKQFLDFELAKVSNIRIESDESQVSLQKLEQGDWQVQETGEARWIQAENPVVQKLLEFLATAKALSFPHDAPSQADLQRLGLESPLRTVTLSRGQNEKAISLLFGQTESGETLYAKLADNPFVYEVDQSMMEQLEPTPLHYRDRRLFPDNPIPEGATLKELKVTTFPDATILLSYPWKKADSKDNAPTTPDALVDPVVKELEKAKVALVLDLSNHIRDLSVKDFSIRGFNEKYFEVQTEKNAWQYQIDAIYKLPEGNDPPEQKLTLLLTERISGTVQGGGHAKSRTAFNLKQETIDQLRKILPAANPPPEYRKPLKEEPLETPANPKN